MKKIFITKSGFTMVELLLYMGLLGIFMTVLTTMFTSVLDVQLESEAVSSVAQDGRYLLSRLTYDIHRANSIIAPVNLGEPSSTSLSLNIDGVVTSYTITNGNLVMSNDNGNNNLNGFDTEVSGLTVTRLGNSGGKNTLTLEFTLTGKAIRPGNNLETKTYQTTIGLR